ncbi:MAG: hypothetical protein RLY78_869 [Pseudomonadota bacterium]|uniref:Uncharacterized protein n=1 Tax=Pseudaquabacterium rugosum TaxID=2984194 RepID=A0ABU9BBX4_9BURK
MNVLSSSSSQSSPSQTCELLDIVDFKWLMAGAGHSIHVERLQRDTAYAQACLQLGCEQPVLALRQAAQRVASRMGLTLTR